MPFEGIKLRGYEMDSMWIGILDNGRRFGPS